MNQQGIRLSIGRNIRRKRLINGLSEDELAARLGISPKRLLRYESGADSPTCDEIIEMAAVLRCTVDDLCRDYP